MGEVQPDRGSVSDRQEWIELSPIAKIRVPAALGPIPAAHDSSLVMPENPERQVTPKDSSPRR
jgi:hypothetical protein